METLAIIAVFFVPAVLIGIIVWIKSSEKTKRRQLQADLYAKALEKGQPIPPDLFPEPKQKDNPLHVGIVLVATGLGLSVFLGMVSSIGVGIPDAIKVAGVGIIPLFIGIAYVIIHFIEKGKSTDEDAK